MYSCSSSSSSFNNNPGKDQCQEEQLLEPIQVERSVCQQEDLMVLDHSIQEVEAFEMINLQQHNSSRTNFKIESTASSISQLRKMFLLNQIRIIAATHQWGKIFQSTEVNQRVDNSNNPLERKVITRLIKVVIQSRAKFKCHPLSSLSLIKFNAFSRSSNSNQHRNKSLRE